MSTMHLLTLGVGNAFASLYYSTCLAVEADGVWLLVDCPHPIRKMMREARAISGVTVDLEHVAGIALSHLHADHSSGLEGIAFYMRFQVGKLMTLLAHPAISEHLWASHLAASMEWVTLAAEAPAQQQQLSDFIQIVPLDETQAVQFGPFTIQCRRTIHSIPTTAFLIRAGGRCLGYSADTAFDANLLDWLSPADMIVHEAGPGLLHTPYEMLAALPTELRARMRLIHYSDNFNLQTSIIEPLLQGKCYQV